MIKSEIKTENNFKYIEEGKGDVILLLHGLFGAISNWGHVLEKFSSNYRVIIPLIPIYELPLTQSNLKGLLEYLERFTKQFGLASFNLIGNSLGGHLALMYTIKNPTNVMRLVLTASSGLFENSIGGSFPRRSNYDYVSERVGYTFFDPKTVDKTYIDEVFEVTSNAHKAIRVVSMAKSAQRNNLEKELKEITTKTLLIWGLNDTITPTMVAHEFNSLLKNSQLRFIDKCCHAPMMEHPQKFNEILDKFLQQNK